MNNYLLYSLIINIKSEFKFEMKFLMIRQSKVVLRDFFITVWYIKFLIPIGGSNIH